MREYTTDAPVFSDSIPIVEENDLVNAENDNAAALQLLQNILVLKQTKVDKEEGKGLVSDQEKAVWNALYEQLTGYTDKSIADLINGAPETRDTLGEIAAAMKENEDVVKALHDAIGSKADLNEMESLLGMKLDKTGDAKDVTVSYESSDTTAASSYTEVPVLTGKEKFKEFCSKVSTMFKNIRYLRRLLGTTDISKLGDGTVTGALSALNTGLAAANNAANAANDNANSRVYKVIHANGGIVQCPDGAKTYVYFDASGQFVVRITSGSTHKYVAIKWDGLYRNNDKMVSW